MSKHDSKCEDPHMELCCNCVWREEGRAEGRRQGLEEARRTHVRHLMMSLRDAPLGLMKAALVVAEVALENDGAVDGETLQGYAAIRALKEKKA